MGLGRTKRINKLLTFYNYKFLDVDVRLFFMPFYCLQAIKNNRIQIRNGWGLGNGWGKRSKKWKNKITM
mgnify:FL=1